MEESTSFLLAKKYLGKEVEIVINRPLGSKHPKWGCVYEANYGYVSGVKAPDGDELDAYFLGVNKSLERAKGKCIAIVHRIKDDDDKLVIVPTGIDLTVEQIEKVIYFQEKWFEHKIVKQQIRI